MALKSLIVFGSILTLKLVVRASINGWMPGLGFIVDFAEVATDCYTGNYLGAGLGLVFGYRNVKDFSYLRNLKDAAKKSAQDSFIQAAKEIAKTDGKKMVGKQVASALAKGGMEQAFTEVFSASTKVTFKNLGKTVGLSMISSGGHEVGKTVCGDVFQFLGEPVLENVLKGGAKQTAQSFSHEWMKEAAKRSLAKEFIKYSSKKFVRELKTASLKGSLIYLLKTFN